MNHRSNYNTRQKEILMDYMESVSGTHFTAADVLEFFKEQGAPIGQSTIYRRLESLVDQGLLNKYTVDGSTAACFEYLGEGAHGEEEVCYHCKCEKCGKLIHLHCEEIREIQDHLMKDHRFEMDPKRTVFYGLCDQCRK